MVNIVFASIDLMIIKVNGVNVTIYIISIVNTRIVLVKDLWGPLMMVRCRFAKHCPNYVKDSYSCNNDLEAINYCGIARQFKRIEFVDVRDLR